MNSVKYFLALAVIFSIFSCATKRSIDLIDGYWVASFADSIKHPKQFYHLKSSNNSLQIWIDEPKEDWYDIPGEQTKFQNGSLSFERFWGSEKYEALYVPNDSTFSGFKHVKHQSPIAFIMRRIQPEALTYKASRVNEDGKKALNYQYVKPKPDGDSFPCTSLEDIGIDSLPIVALMNQILSGKLPNIHSILIMKDNQLVLEEYFHDYSPEKLHRVHSVTKSITSALIGIAIDRGLINDVKAPVDQYFNEYEESKWVRNHYDIHIEHLLSMTAGLDWKGLAVGEANDDMAMYQSNDYYNFILNKEQMHSPGEHFYYNNGLSLMLGRIIEKSSGQSVNSFAQEHLFYPLGISNYTWDVDANGTTRTDGGLKLRPRDMLKFGQLYLNGGNWEHRKVISDAWIQQSTTTKIQSSNLEYAFHWWKKDYLIYNAIFRTYYALGHGEQAIILVPAHHLVFVMTAGNYLQPEHQPFEILKEYILPSIKTSVALPIDAYLEPFIGRYKINSREHITIEEQDDVLYAKDPSGITYKLIPASSCHYLIENTPREVVFIKNLQDEIIAAEIYIDGVKADRFDKINDSDKTVKK